MDYIDKKLLTLLQQNSRMSIKQLAEKVFLSSPSVAARIKKLKDDGVILAYTTLIDPVKLEYHITAFINLEVDPKMKPEFYEAMRIWPNVLECNCVTGSYSMLLRVAFHSTVDLDNFIGVLQQYGHTQTQIVFASPISLRGINILSQEDV
jgi:Lrp/AsnC family transcriptional regulator, leucine-responsive regulatory protein